MMGSYPSGPAPPSSIVCQPADNDMEMYHSRGVGTGMNDDESSSVAGGDSSKDKGRGSYKCGRVSEDLAQLSMWGSFIGRLVLSNGSIHFHSVEFPRRVMFVPISRN
jgi:hypothetical protein